MPLFIFPLTACMHAAYIVYAGGERMAQVTLSTRISPEADKLLSEYAERTGESKASVVEKALINYITKENEK